MKIGLIIALYVKHVTSENSTRQLSGFVFLMFLLVFMSQLFSPVLMLVRKCVTRESKCQQERFQALKNTH